MIASLTGNEPTLNPFIVFAFADLKKYTYHYWFSFPALVSKPAWQLEERFTAVAENVCRGRRDMKTDVRISKKCVICWTIVRPMLF